MTKLMIKGTFIDEISHDIPHQNWGEKEWDTDFLNMKNAGIEFVILIRCGYNKWCSYPSKVLQKEVNIFQPQIDLVDMFLRLCEKHELDFYFGLYDSGKHWVDGKTDIEIDLNCRVIEEVWSMYGNYTRFRGWYISHESSGNSNGIISLYNKLGAYCKKTSNNLKVIISPYIDGVKNVSQYTGVTTKSSGISLSAYKKEWSLIIGSIKDNIDIIAFQDGHVEYDQLNDFLKINKELCDENHIDCWTNLETFDRDMPIKFLPIKWDKLHYKINVAKEVGIQHAITFEFSHFMSPQSSYIQAHHLYNRYMEYIQSNENET